MDLLRPIVKEMNLLEDQWKEQDTKISQLNSEIAGYSEARERELPLVQEVESKVKELREMIDGFNSNQMSLRTSIRNLKEKNGQMDEKVMRIMGAEPDSLYNVIGANLNMSANNIKNCRLNLTKPFQRAVANKAHAIFILPTRRYYTTIEDNCNSRSLPSTNQQNIDENDSSTQ